MLPISVEIKTKFQLLCLTLFSCKNYFCSIPLPWTTGTCIKSCQKRKKKKKSVYFFYLLFLSYMIVTSHARKKQVPVAHGRGIVIRILSKVQVTQSISIMPKPDTISSLWGILGLTLGLGIIQMAELLDWELTTLANIQNTFHMNTFRWNVFGMFYIMLAWWALPQ